jgi:hypothetical protein
VRELKRIPLDLDENAHVSFKPEHINWLHSLSLGHE